MTAPLVSVIIPAYNSAAFLAETLNSVLAQSYPNWEAVVVNDGSTDETLSVLAQYRDARIRCLDRPHMGVSESRNAAIRSSEGKYLAFLDADDFFAPDNLRKKIGFLEARPQFGLVYAKEAAYDTGRQQIAYYKSGTDGLNVNHLLEFAPPGINSPSSVVMRRDAFEATGEFDPNLSTSADWELWVRALRHARIGYLAESLSFYRLHANQLHQDIDRMAQDMSYAFAKCRQADFFRSDAHYRYCYAKLALILSGSYWQQQRHYFKTGKYLASSLLNNPVHVWRKLTGTGTPPDFS